jgi:hypothetical protein
MIGQAVAYIASAFKMAATKESFLAQRVYEQIREQPDKIKTLQSRRAHML